MTRSKKEPSFADLEGLNCPFYGVDNNSFKLGQLVFVAVEDENDGYRSYLETIKVNPTPDDVFFKRPLAYVTIVYLNAGRDNGYFEGYHLVDSQDGHVWLRVGTSQMDEYYPYFTFDYTPKENNK